MIWGYHYFWKHPYKPSTLTGMISPGPSMALMAVEFGTCGGFFRSVTQFPRQIRGHPAGEKWRWLERPVGF